MQNIQAFFCLWKSRADKQHYLVKNLPVSKSLFLVPTTSNTHLSSIEKSKTLLPNLYIKLGLANQFIKAPKPIYQHIPFFRSLHFQQMLFNLFQAKLNFIVTYPLPNKYTRYVYICWATDKKMMADTKKNGRSNVCSTKNVWKAFKMTEKNFL